MKLCAQFGLAWFTVKALLAKAISDVRGAINFRLPLKMVVKKESIFGQLVGFSHQE